MKNFLKYILQKTLGLQNYLYLFARYVILRLPFDKNEKGFLRFIELIENDGHVLDIGANIGVMSYYFSKRLPNSSIHAFEPVPDNFKVLSKIKHQLRLFNLKTYALALGDKNGQVKMIMPEINKIYFHGLSHVEKKDSEIRGKSYFADIKRLDDLKQFNDCKISAMKIDVEEYEYDVLAGGENLITINRPIIYCELWEGKNRTKSINFITKLNYKVFINQGKKLKEFTGQLGYQNFFFIPAERCDKVKL